MKAKEYLSQARVLDQRITISLERVDRLRSMTQKITATMNSEPVSHTRNVSSMEDMIIRLMEEKDALSVAISQLLDLKHEITAVLDQIQDPDRHLILEMRYLCYNTWEQIAEVMNMHVRTVFRLHGRALQDVDRILSSENYQEKLKSVSVCQ